MPEPFSLSAGQIRLALDWMLRYYETLPERPVLVPATSAELRAALDEPLPRSASEFSEILRAFDEHIVRYSRHNGHPRFFGYVASPGGPVNAAGALLEATLNVNATAWRSGPAAAEVEHTAIGWMKEILGYPASAAGLFTSGGSMANFAALAAARSAKAPGNIVRDGLMGSGPAMCLYASRESHFSIAKAAGMLGLGEANVHEVPTDGRFQMDVAALESRIAADRAAGMLPFCVVANAGSTATGAVDPIAAIGEVARRHDLWFHVDAAYGGFAALAPSVRHLFAGMETADSIALDPHKWLYLPVGCGCVLYRRPETALAAFRHDADYTRPIGVERDEAFAFWDYGPELSRPFRALQIWLWVKFAGADALGRAIEHNTACARHLEHLVNESVDFEMLAPVVLSIFCFRYRPRGFAGDLNALNERILVVLQRDGSSYLSNALLGGRFALRGCVLNYRTMMRDMEVLLDDVRRAAAVVVSQGEDHR